MKVSVASDLHVEFGDIILKNEDSVELLILAGDICAQYEALDAAAFRDYCISVVKSGSAGEAVKQSIIKSLQMTGHKQKMLQTLAEVIQQMETARLELNTNPENI